MTVKELAALSGNARRDKADEKMQAGDRAGRSDEVGQTEEAREVSNLNDAYRNRPFLNAAVVVLYACICIFVLFGATLIFTSTLLKAVLAFGVAGVLFLGWGFLHNWALTHSAGSSEGEGV